MIISRSRVLQTQHLHLFTDNVPLTARDSLKILGATFDNKFTFEHLSVSSVTERKTWLVKEIFKIHFVCLFY